MRRSLSWFSCAFALGLHSPLRAEPAGAAPSVPVALGTHDPSYGRPSFSVITQPAKRPQLTAAASDEAHANVKVSGLTGTLNRDDVHQTMEARQGDFDACIVESRRTLRWVSGAIRFSFKVDGEGRIAEVHAASSTIGHRDLERCLTTVVATTQFPAPAGRATAEFSWGLHVDPSGAKPPEESSPKPLARVIHKESRDLFKTCEIKRRRARFRITAYLAPNGHVLSAGAVPLPASADDKVDCVLEQFGKWHMPKLKHASKISFDLR